MLSRLDDFKKQYQLTAKVNIEFSQSYNDERDKHIIADKDRNKLISFTPEEINKNINKLKKLTIKFYMLLVYIFCVGLKLDF